MMILNFGISTHSRSQGKSPTKNLRFENTQPADTFTRMANQISTQIRFGDSSLSSDSDSSRPDPGRIARLGRPPGTPSGRHTAPSTKSPARERPATDPTLTRREEPGESDVAKQILRHLGRATNAQLSKDDRLKSVQKVLRLLHEQPKPNLVHLAEAHASAGFLKTPSEESIRHFEEVLGLTGTEDVAPYFRTFASKALLGLADIYLSTDYLDIGKAEQNFTKAEKIIEYSRTTNSVRLLHGEVRSKLEKAKEDS